MSEKVAVLGLGAMGSRMAARLLDAGYAVSVYNRTAKAAEPLVALGATGAASPREAVQGCGVVIACVRDDEAARAIWLGEGGLSALEPGSVVVESSTLTPACVSEIAAEAAAQGVIYLDAPVVGTRPQAEAGQLVYLVGGEREGLSRARPILEVLAGAIHYVGASGTGATLKLAVNALFTVQVAAMAEALSLASGSGIDRQAAFEVLGALPVTSAAAKGAASLMLAGKHTPMFPIELVVKDLGYVEAAAEQAEVSVPITAAARAVYAQAQVEGDGGLNVTAVARQFGGLGG